MRVTIGYIRENEPNAPFELWSDFFIEKMNKTLRKAIISDKDCTVYAKMKIPYSCDIVNCIDYKSLTDIGWKCVFEFYLCGEKGFIFKKRFYADGISLSLSSETVRAKLYSNIISGGNGNE